MSRHLCTWGTCVLAFLIVAVTAADIVLFRGRHLVDVLVCVGTVGIFLGFWGFIWWCLHDLCKIFRGE